MMQIEAVDFFYVKMPDVTTEGDGSQDALLVRVAAGGHVGWGECEAAPLVSIDFNHDSHSSTFDATQTQVVDGALVENLHAQEALRVLALAEAIARA